MELTADFQRLNLVDNRQDKLDQSIITSADGDHLSIVPNEILEIIFSYLRPKFLHQNVLPVCRRFHGILSDKKWWIRRIRNHHLNARLSEAELGNAEFSPVRTYDAMLREEILRREWNERKRLVISTGERRIVGVKLFERAGEKYCLSASGTHERCLDNYIQLWNMDVAKDDTSGRTPLVHECAVGRDEIPASSYWQERLCELEMCNGRSFLTRDHNIKLWDIGEAGFRKITGKPADDMCGLSLQDNTLACGVLKNFVSLRDVNNGLQEIVRSNELPVYGDHSLIQAVKLKGTTIYALFTNQLMTLDVRNLHAGPVQRHLFDDLPYMMLNGVRCCRNWYTSMSVADGLIHCCHNGGEISVLQASDLTPCYSFYMSEDVEERYFLNCVAKTRGSVLVCGRRSVRAFSLGSQPVCLGVANYNPGTAALDVLHEDVVIGATNRTITYWSTDEQ